MAYSSVGIIPAGGKAVRFNGIMKECLPDKQGTPLILRTVRQLEQFCDAVVVISNPEKISEHARFLGTSCLYRMTHGQNDMWKGIESGLQIPAQRYWLQMPDTAVDYSFDGDSDSSFLMGTFETDKPERFGCLHDGWIVNKNRDIPTPARAWGVLSWTKAVADMWFETEPQDYTEAINHAIGLFDYQTFELESYNDMATIRDYQDYLR